MKAIELLRQQAPVAEDAFVSVVVWQVSQPVPPSAHGYKFRLAHVVGGVCVLRYDNERGKGDHRNWGDVETPYAFADRDRLLSDFHADIARWNHEDRDL